MGQASRISLCSVGHFQHWGHVDKTGKSYLRIFHLVLTWLYLALLNLKFISPPVVWLKNPKVDYHRVCFKCTLPGKMFIICGQYLRWGMCTLVKTNKKAYGV